MASDVFGLPSFMEVVVRALIDVGNRASIEENLAIGLGVRAAIEVVIGTLSNQEYNS